MAKLFANNTISTSYKEQLQLEHDGSKWGSTAVKYCGYLLYECLRTRPYITTMLDFGCGKAALEPWLAKHYPDIKYTGYDPGIPGKDTMPSGQFDIVVTSDVLEHIEPEVLDVTIQKLASLAKYVQFNDIACSPTHKLFASGPYKGQDLHLTVEEPEWWRKKFQRVSPLKEAHYEHREKASHKGRRPRCLLIHERV
jgi:hypothetical protein